MLEVTVSHEEEEDRAYSFDKPSIMIGRAIGNDICLTKGGISRYHARMSLEGESVSIEDLDSTNGTFVNSEKVKQAELSDKDKVTIGGYVLIAHFESNEPFEMEEDVAVEDNQDSQIEIEITEEVLPGNDIVSETDGMSRNDLFYWEALERFLSPIWGFILDEDVSEIMINGPEEIYLEKKGKLELSNAKFTNDQLKAAVLNIAQYVGRRVSSEEPYLDARLPDGSRVAVLLPPCGRKGISIAIRKFGKEALTLEKLLSYGSLSQEMVTFLRAAVVLKKNILISGGTSSGKTSLLNVVSSLIPSDERILTIEDSAELQLMQDHVVPMETKSPDKKGRGEVTIRDLVKASLRMRPDRIVVGEIRGGEALDLLQAMNTGHSGSMATTHASSPSQCLTRIETLAMFSGIEIPMRALREQVSTAIDIVVQASRLPDHSRKVTHISEIDTLTEDGRYVTHDIFKFNRTGGSADGKIEGEHVWTGYKPSLLPEMELAGLTEALALFEK